jgi:hypothetical protein
MNCRGLETCTTEGNGITTTREDAFHGNSRTCKSAYPQSEEAIVVVESASHHFLTRTM